MAALGLTDVDLLIVVFAIMTVMAVAIAMFYRFFLPDGKVDGVKRRLRPDTELAGATIIYTGDQTGGALGYIAKFVEGEAYKDSIGGYFIDTITRRKFLMSPIDWEKNIRIFKNINLLEGKVILGCNIDMMNRPHNWDPMATQMYEHHLDAVTEEKIEQKVLEKLDFYKEFGQNSKTKSTSDIPTTDLNMGGLQRV